MRSLVSLLRLAPLLVLGCNPVVIEADTAGDEQGSSSDESSSSSSESSSSSGESSVDTTELGDDEPCPAGTPGCPCDAGGCQPGYECVGDICVESSTTSDTTDMTTDTTTDTTTETGGKEQHSCGWLPEKNYYFCGSLGEPDPNMVYPMDCAEFDFPMIDDAPCGAELTYVGCCDANGDAWYCYQGLVVYEVCGAL